MHINGSPPRAVLDLALVLLAWPWKTAPMTFGSPDHPFYKPLWRRLVIIAITGLWTLLEVFRGGEPLWIVLSGGAFLYSLWTFLITWKDPPPDA